MNSKAILSSLLLLLLLVGLPLNKSFAQGGQLETVDSKIVTDYSRLAVALEQSGLKYQKADANVWVISMQLEGKPAYDVRILGDNEIIMFIVPLTQMPDKLTPEMLGKLDELNGKYFFVKFVHDENSVYFRVDALLYSIDGVAVRSFVNALNVAVEKEGGDLIKLISTEAPSKSKSK